MSNKRVCGYLNFSSGTTGLPKAVSYVSFFSRCFFCLFWSIIIS